MLENIGFAEFTTCESREKWKCKLGKFRAEGGPIGRVWKEILLYFIEASTGTSLTECKDYSLRVMNSLSGIEPILAILQ